MKNQIAWVKEYIKYHPDDQGGAFHALAAAIIADAEENPNEVTIKGQIYG